MVVNTQMVLEQAWLERGDVRMKSTDVETKSILKTNRHPAIHRTETRASLTSAHGSQDWLFIIIRLLVIHSGVPSLKTNTRGIQHTFVLSNIDTANFTYGTKSPMTSEFEKKRIPTSGEADPLQHNSR
ncbi:hypothetical protein FRC03_006925 [Tulasnella sp. 419]|nr:hypothetical protein FRC03_006925 [Tulasnella sp. 419]